MPASSSSPATARTPFGAALQQCRRQRRLSQFDLALRAETPPRHISFLETGRSRPTLGMVQRLADALDLGPADRNHLLTSAGFAADRPVQPLDADAMAAIRTVIAHLLRNHEPWPALLLDATYDIVDANTGARRLLGLPQDTTGDGDAAITRPNLVELLLGPLAPMLANADAVLRETRSRLQRDLERVGVLAATDARTRARARLTDLLARVTAALGSPSRHEPQSVDTPVLFTTLHSPLGPIHTLSTLVHFGGARSETVDALHVELIHPADPHSDTRLRTLLAPA